MMILLILLLGASGVLVSRQMFRSWFNHVSFYTLTWAGTLILFELRLINYYPLQPETWLVILACWLLFLFGSLTVVVALQSNNVSGGLKAGLNPAKRESELQRVKSILWILNALTLAAAIYDLYLVSKLFGGIANAFIFGNLLYSFRVSEGLPGSIPYVSSLIFTAAILAGSYTAGVGRLTLVCVMPLIIILMIDFAYMARADILIVAILFGTGYALTEKGKNTDASKLKTRMRKFAMGLTVLAIIVGGADFIRSTRHMNESIRGSGGALKKLNTASFITPSLYLYLTADYGVLNKIIASGGENTPVGGNTLLPLYRILEKIGVDVHAEVYQDWYRTPVRVNTGTYIRELLGDFGIVGMLLGPYILGILSSIFWDRLKRNGRYTDLALTGFFYTIIGMSIFVMPTRVSPFFFYFFVAVIIGLILDKNAPRRSQLRFKYPNP